MITLTTYPIYPFNLHVYVSVSKISDLNKVHCATSLESSLLAKLYFIYCHLDCDICVAGRQG